MGRSNIYFQFTSRLNKQWILYLLVVVFGLFSSGYVQAGILEFSSATYTEGEGATATITVTRTGAPNDPIDFFQSVEVLIGIGDLDTASAADYTVLASTNLDFPAGSTSQTLNIRLETDNIVEPDETLTMGLIETTPVGSIESPLAGIDGSTARTIGELNTAVLTIVDTTSVFQFSAASYQADEGTDASITITRTGGSAVEESVNIIIGGEGDTATTDDYTPPASTTVTFTDGVTSRTVIIPILADVLEEVNETLTLTLEDPAAVLVAARAIGTPRTAVLTLVDTTEPGVIQFSAANYQLTEGDTANIIVERTGGSDGAIDAAITIGGDGDTASGADYTPQGSVPVSFADGETVQSIPITALTDTLDEGDETVSLGLTISPNSQGTIGTPSSAVLTISDPAVGELNFSAASFTVSEADGNAVITVTRTGGDVGVLEADVQIGGSGDTATTDDYTDPASNRLTWADGDVADKTLNIPITADLIVENDETLALALVAVNNAPIGATNQAVLTITDTAPEVDSVGIVTGDRQTGEIGTELDPFVILVEDANGNPIENATVNWEITPTDGGTLDPGATTVTDANGNSSNILTLNTDEQVVVTARVADEAVDPINFVINPRLISPEGLTGNQRSIVTALNTACEALRGTEVELTAEQLDLLATCDRLETTDNLAAELDLLIPDEVSSQGTAVIKAANLQVMNVNSRLNALRSGSRGLSVSGLGIQVEGVALPNVVLSELVNNQATGGAAGEGDTFNRWGAFINGNISFGTKDRTTNENGFDFDTRGVTAGIDYRVSNDLVVGAALGYGTNKSDFDSSTGDMDMDGWHITGYGTYYKNQQIYLDGVIKLGFNNYDTTRRVSPDGAALQNAIGETDGKEISLSVGGGYEIARDAMTIGGYGRIGYTKADIDSYTETAQNPGVPGIGSMLSIASQDVDSLTTTLGTQLSYAINTKKGVFIPQGRLEWEHEFSDDQRDINAQFVADPTSTTFGIRTDEADRDYFNIGLGFSAITPGGKSGFLYYETRLDQDDIEQHWIKGGFRFEF